MNEIYSFGSFGLDTRERRLTCEGKPIRLRPKVFDTLCALVERHGKLVTKDELMKLVWPDAVVEENNLALNVAAIRKALRKAEPHGKWIETVTGKGYRFRGDVRLVAGGQAGAPQPVSRVVDGTQARLLEREQELDVLRESLQLASEGRRQFVCITGEAGIGKTALLDVFLDRLCGCDGPLIGLGQCVEHSGEGEAYMPVIEALGRMCRGAHGAEVIELVERHAPAWLAQMPSLIEPDRFASIRERILGITSHRMLREFAELVEALTTRYAAVLALEDLHWADPSTLELVSSLARRQGPARILLIATNRAGDAGESGRALESLSEELELRGQCRLIRPSLLSQDAIAAMASGRTPAQALPQVARAIRERTSGNPLFAHALMDYWQSQGGSGQLPRGVPGNLRAMIQRKLERLDKEEEELLACASVAGRQFSSASVASALERGGDEVEERLAALAAQGSILRPSELPEWAAERASAGFAFRHSLYQEVVYDQIPRGRRSRLHRRLGEHLEQAWGESASGRAAELARHFLEGRDPERALTYLQAAAESALQRSAHREAAVHLRRGVELLKSLPETREHQMREFRLLSLLAPTLIAIEGFSASDAEYSYRRATELGTLLGKAQETYPLLLGQAFMHELRGEYYRTEDLLGERLQLPVEEQYSMVAVHSESLMACSLFHQGQFAGALERAEHGAEIYDPARDRELLAPYGENPSVACQSWAALSLWFLGFPDRAAARAKQLVSFTEAPNHLYLLSTASMYAAHVFQLRRDHLEAEKWADKTLHLAGDQGYLYNVAFAQVILGWARAVGGSTEEGLALINRGLATACAIGAKLDRPYLLALAAESRLCSGDSPAAMDLIAEALSLVESSRAFFYEAELYRLRAAAGSPDSVESDLRYSFDIAWRQGAASLQLRTATDLAKLLQSRGQTQRARELLHHIYSAFQEGFETRDLQQAHRLMDQLA